MLRVQLRAELAGIGIAIAERGLKDEITQECQKWHNHFVQELGKSSEEEKMLSLYTHLLQEILKDPMPCIHSPLEEDSYLANDGHVYGFKALCVYKFPGLFFVEETPHLVVKTCILWLKKRGQHLPVHPDVALHFENLEKIPPLPTEKIVRRQQKIRALQEEEQIRKAGLQEAQNQRREEEALRTSSKVATIYASVIGPIQKSVARQGAELEEVALRDQKAQQLMDDDKKQFVEKIKVLDERVDQLQNQLQNEANLLSETQKETLKLEVEITKTERILDERRAKAESEGGSWLAIAIVIVCAVITESLPDGWSVVPVPGGAGIGKMF